MVYLFSFVFGPAATDTVNVLVSYSPHRWLDSLAQEDHLRCPGGGSGTSSLLCGTEEDSFRVSAAVHDLLREEEELDDFFFQEQVPPVLCAPGRKRLAEERGPRRCSEEEEKEEEVDEGESDELPCKVRRVSQQQHRKKKDNRFSCLLASSNGVLCFGDRWWCW